MRIHKSYVRPHGQCWNQYLTSWSLTSLGSIFPDLDSNPAIWRTSQQTPVGKQCMLLRRLSTNRFVMATRQLLVHLRYSCSRTLYSGDPSGPNFFRRSSGGNLNKNILQTYQSLGKPCKQVYCWYFTNCSFNYQISVHMLQFVQWDKTFLTQTGEVQQQ